MCALVAMVAVRAFGAAGIVAIALGWVAYTYSQNKAGTLFAILIGAVVALATYGFAAVGLGVLIR